MLPPAIRGRAKEAESVVLSVFTSWCGHKGVLCVSLNAALTTAGALAAF